MKGFNMNDFNEKLKLIGEFKKKQPQTFDEAFQVAIAFGVGKNQTIVEAIEVYAVEKGFNKTL